MKVFRFFLPLFLLITQIHAQDASLPISEEKRHNRVYFNMFDLVYSTFGVAYERDIKRNSLLISAGGILMKNNSRSRTGGSGEVQYRINLIDEKAGYENTVFLYFAPYAQFRYIDEEEKAIAYAYSNSYYASYSYINRANLRSYNGGALLGLSLYAMKRRLCFSFFAGGGLRYVDIRGSEYLFDQTVFSVGYSGVLPRFGFQFGVGF